MSTTTLASGFALIPLALASLLAAFAWAPWFRRDGRAVSASSLRWLAVFVGVLLLVALYLGGGLVTSGFGPVAAASLALFAGGLSCLLRDEALARVDSLPGWGGRLARAGLLALALPLSVICLELPWNGRLWQMEPRFLWLELAMVGLALLAAYLLGRESGGVALLVPALCYSLGLAQFFMKGFKGTAILPGDVLSVRTAMAVTGSYSYYVDGPAVWGLVAFAGAAILLSLATPASAPPRRGRMLACLAGGLACLGLLWDLVTQPDYREGLGVGIDSYWYSLDCYGRQGFLPSFVSAVQDLRIKRPDGYSTASAREAEEVRAAAWEGDARSREAYAQASAQFRTLRPSVVVVMDESFSDLSVFGDLGIGYAGPTYATTATEGVLSRGPLAVSVLGGGTCNSEFEFLTGNSMAFVGGGSYPYSLYDLGGVGSLARQLRDEGYRCTAIHPNLATNWNRHRVYPQLGFDEFLDIDDFEGAPTYHTGVSDGATFGRILDILRSSDEPQFVFDVTMANHSGYDTGDVSWEDMGEMPEVPGLDDELESQLREYLACVHRSDFELQDLVVELSELERPVVLLYFGDHQPYFTPFMQRALGGGEGDAAAAMLCYQSVYLTWTNYDVAGRREGVSARTSCAAFLASQLMAEVGGPLDGFQRAQLGIAEDLPAVSPYGALDVRGGWHDVDAPDDPTLGRALRDLAQIQYRHFAEKVQ